MTLTAGMEREARSCFNFFWEQCNSTEGSKGYGLIRDRFPHAKTVASIASVGYGLAAYAYGVFKNYITMAEGRERVEKSLDALSKLNTKHGFYQHFYNIETGEAKNCEYSTIDTAILICGIVIAKNFFGEKAAALADKIIDRVEWDYIVDENDIFHMAFFPDGKFIAKWDGYSEQLMMYILGAMSKKHKIEKKVYYTFERPFASYKNYNFCYSIVGSIFTHQFSHAFIDFENHADENGMDWFENSVTATLAARQFCIDNKDVHPTYNENCWGLTACDTPSGYRGDQGSTPCGFNNTAGKSMGVVPPAGALGSFPFTPEHSLNALNYYQSLERAQTQYGLCDAISTEIDWFAEDVIGIDKGVTLLMMANAECRFMWRYFESDIDVKKAKEYLGIKLQKAAAKEKTEAV